MLDELEKRINEIADPEKAKIYQRFFKTGEGQYGEGDVFIGLSVPQSRSVAREFLRLSLEDIRKLLDSKVHEERLIGLLILVGRFKESGEKGKTIVYNFYIENLDGVNNWDLVDLSADKIVGSYLMDRDKDILYELVESDDLWERRISIISTFHFIKNGQFGDSLKISEILLKDKHDLIHKAVGWMLREIGKKDVEVLESFLGEHYKEMPRTMLRYAIEKFDEDKRKRYLKGEI